MKPNYDFSKGVKNPYIDRVKRPKNMGRIVASVRIDNASDLSRGLRCNALVDTGASFMVLPMAWRDRLGNLETMTEVEMETATRKQSKASYAVPCVFRSKVSVPFITK